MHNTSLLLPWLLRHAFPAGGTKPGGERRVQLVALYRSVNNLHRLGLEVVPDQAIALTGDQGVLGELPSRPGGTCSPGRHVFEAFPQVFEWWQTAREGDGFDFLPLDPNEASVCDFVAFSVLLRSFARRHAAAAKFGKIIGVAANNYVAATIEAWLLHKYIPSMAGEEHIEQLFTKSGFRE